MEKLTLEATSKDKHEFIFALQETIKQLEDGFTSGDLRNEDIENGYWEIKEIT